MHTQLLLLPYVVSTANKYRYTVLHDAAILQIEEAEGLYLTAESSVWGNVFKVRKRSCICIPSVLERFTSSSLCYYGHPMCELDLFCPRQAFPILLA